MPSDSPDHKPKLEQTNMGYYIVDCPTCGNVGVWESRGGARAAADRHESKKSHG